MSGVSPRRAAGWTARWFTEELTALSRAGNWEGAMAVFRQMQQSNLLEQNVFHYTTVINACGHAGQLDAALDVFEKMKAHRVAPNVYTYTALINGCAVARKTDVALRLFAEMRLSEVVPNVRTMTALATACATTGNWQRAMRVIDECAELMIAPNVFTYTAAMDGCRRAGVCAPAVQLLRTAMRNPYNVRPNEVTYNTVLGACVAAKELQMALRVYAAMAADGYQPTAYTKDLLVTLFKDTALEGMADDLPLRVRPPRRGSYVPDADPVVAMQVENSAAAVNDESTTSSQAGEEGSHA